MRQENRATEIAIAVPIAFGAIWAVDASINWEPAFHATSSRIASGVDKGKPSFLTWFFSTWQRIVRGRAPIRAVLSATRETSRGVALITGFARKLTYELFVGSVARGFRGPYMPGTTTDVGAAIVYSLVFWALLLVDAGRMSVDRMIAARAPAWRRMAG